MVGAPNKGSDFAYYVWEGGDPIKADKSAGDSLYIYTNTLFYFYRDRFGKKFVILNWFGLVPKLNVMKMKCIVLFTKAYAH